MSWAVMLCFWGHSRRKEAARWLAEITFSMPVNLTGSSSGLSRAEMWVPGATHAGSGLASLLRPAAAAARGGLSPVLILAAARRGMVMMLCGWCASNSIRGKALY